MAGKQREAMRTTQLFKRVVYKATRESPETSGWACMYSHPVDMEYLEIAQGRDQE